MLQGMELCFHDTERNRDRKCLFHTHSLSYPSHTSAPMLCSIRGIKMRSWEHIHQRIAAPNVDEDLRGLMGPSFSTESRTCVCRAATASWTGEGGWRRQQPEEMVETGRLREDNSSSSVQRTKFTSLHAIWLLQPVSVWLQVGENPWATWSTEQLWARGAGSQKVFRS